jgi:hypothetical protein
LKVANASLPSPFQKIFQMEAVVQKFFIEEDS